MSRISPGICANSRPGARSRASPDRPSSPGQAGPLRAPKPSTAPSGGFYYLGNPYCPSGFVSTEKPFRDSAEKAVKAAEEALAKAPDAEKPAKQAALDAAKKDRDAVLALEAKGEF